MHDQMRTVLKRLHQIGGGERGVNHQWDSIFPCDFSDYWNIHDIVSRVSDHFPENHPGIGLDGVADSIDIPGGHKGGVNAKPGQGVLEQVMRAPVNCTGRNDMGACIHDRGNCKMQGGLSAGGSDPANAIFQGGNSFFENGGGGIGQSGIGMAGAFHIEQGGGLVAVLEHIARSLVDRYRAGTMDRVGSLPGMQCQGIKSCVYGSCHPGFLSLVWGHSGLYSGLLHFKDQPE